MLKIAHRMLGRHARKWSSGVDGELSVSKILFICPEKNDYIPYEKLPDTIGHGTQECGNNLKGRLAVIHNQIIAVRDF